MSNPTISHLEDAFGGWVQCAPVALIRSITNFFKVIPHCSAPHIPLYFIFLRSKHRLCSTGCLRSDLLQQTGQINWSHRLKKTEEYFTSVCYNSTSQKDTDSLIYPHCRAKVLLTELIINTRNTKHIKNCWENEPIVQQYAKQRHTKLVLHSVCHILVRHIKTHFKYAMAHISYCTDRLSDITSRWSFMENAHYIAILLTETESAW